MAIREETPETSIRQSAAVFCSKCFLSNRPHADEQPYQARQNSAAKDFATDLRRLLRRRLQCAPSTLDNALTNAWRYGVNIFTTVCTARLVPFTVLCATFLAVIAELFATFLAVRTGPPWTVLAQTANARMTENNAFIVLLFRSSEPTCVYAR
jgi:hypothetical protein